MASLLSVQDIQVVNEGKPAGAHILTGVGYLDHMIDQFNSHAQIGIGLRVDLEDEDKDSSNRNRLASSNQVHLCSSVGSDLGKAFLEKLPLPNTNGRYPPVSRFCCPLDEALVECTLKPGKGNLEYTLPPYGSYPTGKGRSKIGQLETFAIESFWRALAESTGLDIALRKIRGENGHHIVESSFKAFSRAIRNYLDEPGIWEQGSPNDIASVQLKREAKVERSTKETSISVHLSMNGKCGNTKVETGIPVLDDFFTALATEACMTLKIRCDGDMWVDDHHTAEDVSIAVGQCLTQALGTKAGLNRMWLASATEGKASVEVTMDLSNRPYLGHNLEERLGQQEYVDPENAPNGESSSMLSCEMLEHVLDSLVMNGRMTVHVVEQPFAKMGDSPPTTRETVMATAKAFGRALRVCAMVDTRRAGRTASSKGTLSV